MRVQKKNFVVTRRGAAVQGTSKWLFPGCDNMWWKNCVCLPEVGKQNATLSPDFTQPGKSLLEVPYIFPASCQCSFATIHLASFPESGANPFETDSTNKRERPDGRTDGLGGLSKSDKTDKTRAT